jgi:hypothetical protein
VPANWKFRSRIKTESIKEIAGWRIEWRTDSCD